MRAALVIAVLGSAWVWSMASALVAMPRRSTMRNVSLPNRSPATASLAAARPTSASSARCTRESS